MNNYTTPSSDFTSTQNPSKLIVIQGRTSSKYNFTSESKIFVKYQNMKSTRGNLFIVWQIQTNKVVKM